jgi:RNA polymerase sigma-70 factor (ECF subfamily)
LVPLGEQDRTRWDRELIKAGQQIVRACLRRNQPGPYQIQAAIQAVHSDAARVEDTDWLQIRQLYDQLLARWPTPVAALNRAVAVAELDGPQAGLALVEALRTDALAQTHLFHTVRAELLTRLERRDEAVGAYDRAIAYAQNAAERAHLTGRRDALADRAADGR